MADTPTVEEIYEAARPRGPRPPWSREWMEFHRRAPKLPPISLREFHERIRDAGEPDEDESFSFTGPTPQLDD